jgi:multiple sugar transport system substrate-binding protein
MPINIIRYHNFKEERMRKRSLLLLIMIAMLLLAACNGAAAPQPTPVPEPIPVIEPTPTEEPAATEPEPAPEPEPTPEEEPTPEAEPTPEPEATPEEEATPEPEAPTAGDVTFFSTQFVPVEEQEIFRSILQEGGFDVTGSEEGPLLDVLLAAQQAGQGDIDVIGTLHGTFPPLQREDALMNLADLAEDLMDDREFIQAFLETGLLDTDDFLYYIPWMQATYIMAARQEALEYLPEGVELDTMTYEQLGEWCQALMEETGEARCGMPHAGLFHRFLQGYLWPSFTGGMVTQFRSDDAVAMLEWAQDGFWPYVSPESINYSFMQEPLLAGDVWVAFDHVARLRDAFTQEPENFVAFPAPSGPAGLGFMPVIVGLGIPETAPNPEGAEELINYLTTPEVQGRVLRELGFYPVVGEVDEADLPEGIAAQLEAVATQSNAENALPALLPVGLGERGGEINQIFRNAFDRVVLNGEAAEQVLQEEGENLQTLMNETGAACWPPDPPSDGPCPVE